MRILISNDDGVDYPGLIALREAVDALGECVVVAPAAPQSATGHSITLKKPLTVRRIRIGPDEHDALSVDGRPADCVRLACRRLLGEPVDLVLSGINAGHNVGVNVFYSGTVAAAAEGAMLGIPSIAISTEALEPTVEAYRPVAKVARQVIEQLLTRGLTGGDLINVNIPPVAKPILGIRVVPQSTAGIEDIYHLHDRNAEGESYRLSDDYSFQHQPDSDVEAVAEGYISLTPLHVDMTNHDRLTGLSERTWQLPESPEAS